MDLHEALVKLLTAGTPPALIIFFFIEQGFEPIEVDEFLHQCGVTLPRHFVDDANITEDRRHELQLLSLTE